MEGTVITANHAVTETQPSPTEAVLQDSNEAGCGIPARNWNSVNCDRSSMTIESPNGSIALPSLPDLPTGANDASDTSTTDTSNEESSSIKLSSTTTNGHKTCTIVEQNRDSEEPVISRGESRLSGDIRVKVWRCSVALGLFAVVAVVWGLCIIPVVFYHIPVCPNMTETTNTGGDQCPTLIPYTGTVCRNELQSFTDCLPNSKNQSSTEILVQSDQSERAESLLSGFSFLQPSPECVEAGVPFLCVHIFSLCDSTGRAYRLSSSQCSDVSTGVCADVWLRAASLGRELPNCASFPKESVLTDTCGGSGSEDNVTSEPDPTLSQSRNGTCSSRSSDNTTNTCRDGFYCSDSEGETTTLGGCLPRCGGFKQHSDTATLVVDVIEILAASVGVISGVAMLVIAVTRRKKIFMFPAAFVVYQTISLLVLAIFVLINYFNRTKLYCSSEDLRESLNDPTPFCIISGIVFYYTIFQVAIWWIFHVAALLWKIRFPFHARRMKLSHIDRYIHVTAIVLGLLLPLFPVIIAMSVSAFDDESGRVQSRCGQTVSMGTQPSGKLGFGMTRFPPILCTGTDQTATYYSFNLPLNVILIAGMTMLIGIFWIIHKKHGLFRVRQGGGKDVMKIGSAERKVLLVFCYYAILAIITLVTQSLVLRNREAFADELLNYFICEQSNPEMPCSREGFEQHTQPVLIALSYAFLTLFPLINFLFVVNIRETKEKLRKWSSSVPHSSTS